MGRNYNLSYQVSLLTEAGTESDIHPPALDIKEQSSNGICISLWGERQLGKTNKTWEGGSWGPPTIPARHPLLQEWPRWRRQASREPLETAQGVQGLGKRSHPLVLEPGLGPPTVWQGSCPLSWAWRPRPCSRVLSPRAGRPVGSLGPAQGGPGQGLLV